MKIEKLNLCVLKNKNNILFSNISPNKKQFAGSFGFGKFAQTLLKHGFHKYFHETNKVLTAGWITNIFYFQVSIWQ